MAAANCAAFALPLDDFIRAPVFGLANGAAVASSESDGAADA
jgi:hypothetical protein